MTSSVDFAWFKANFAVRAQQAAQGTPFTVDFLAALAYQETGKAIWGPLSRRKLPVAEILALCTGDTLDHPQRASAWPRNRAELEAHPQGPAMFAIARAALVAMARRVPGYAAVAARPDKFCHGFGIFQYDIQFFRSADPAYFLNRDYADFDKSLGKALHALREATGRIGLGGRSRLTDAELCAVAIAYNTGGYRPARGLRQGHSVRLPDGTRKYYGEFIREYLLAARAVGVPAAFPPSASRSLPLGA